MPHKEKGWKRERERERKSEGERNREIETKFPRAEGTFNQTN